MREKLTDLIVAIILTVLALLVALPYMWAVLGSFLCKGSPFNLTDLLNPSNYSIETYKFICDNANVSLAFFNSVLISTVGATLSVIINLSGAYILGSRTLPRVYHSSIFKVRKLILLMVFLSLMFPAETKVIVNFITCRYLGLVNKYSGVILPTSANLLTFLLIYQAVLRIPTDIEEAAILDGFKPVELTFNVIAPLLRAELVTAFIFNFVAYWNDFLWSLVILPTAESKYPLQVTLAYLISSFSTNFNQILTVTTIASVPVIVLFFIFKDAFIDIKMER